MKTTSILTALKEDINTGHFIIKSDAITSDVDIIMSEEVFDRIVFNSNFIKIQDRRRCDKHVFYLYLFNNQIHLIDFNIDGLFMPTKKFIPLSILQKNTIKKDNLLFLTDDYYQYYKSIKKEKFSLNIFNFQYVRYTFYRFLKLSIFRKQKIVLVGVDGAGKSTTISNLSQTFNVPTHIEYMGWKNFRLPLLKLYRSHKYKNKVNNEINKSSQNKSISPIKILIYYLELYYRYVETLFSKSIIIIYDRFFFDWILLYKDSILKKILLFIIPKPNLVVFLTGDIQTIYNRKKEVSLEKMMKVNDSYTQFFTSYSENYVIIDTTSISETDVQKIIISKLFH